MSDNHNQKYLLEKQYHTSANLTSRMRLHEQFSTNPANWQRWVFDQLDIPVGGRVLELGTGSGQLWVQNLERVPEDWQITLSDFSPGMLRDAQENLGEQAARFQFATIDAQSIPLDDGSFDCVIANHMLYHVPDRVRALAEIRRVLGPRGRLYAATNGEAHLRDIDALCEKAGIGEGGILGLQAREAFSLQNGPAQLAPLFGQIEIRRFEGDLAVTEVEPLVDFILSTKVEGRVSEEQVQRLREVIEREIAEKGLVHITKETGLIIADVVA